MAGRPGAGTCPPGTYCHPCCDGTLEVQVFLQSLCYDTDPYMGEQSPDRPFNDVEVRISGPTTKPPQRTANGTTTFEALMPGNYSVRVVKAGFSECTDDIVRPPDRDTALFQNPYPVASRATTQAMRVMRRDGLECQRRHILKPGPQPPTRQIYMPFLWLFSDEPWILIVRDLLWIFFTVLAIVFFAVGKPAAGLWATACSAYLLHII